MFENIMKFFKKLNKKESKLSNSSKNAAKERLHLVLMQDRANVSADFLELMKQEIIEVIKKYIDVDERAIDVRLTNKENDDGTNGAPALYANIPILNIKNEARKLESQKKEKDKKEIKKENNKQNNKEVKEETKKEEERQNLKQEETSPKKEIKENSNLKSEKTKTENKEETLKEDLNKENKDAKDKVKSEK